LPPLPHALLPPAGFGLQLPASQLRTWQSPGAGQSEARLQPTQLPLAEHTPPAHAVPGVRASGSQVPLAKLHDARRHAPGSGQSASRAHVTQRPAPTQCPPFALQSLRCSVAPSAEQRTAVSPEQVSMPGMQRLHAPRSASHKPGMHVVTSR
jgi:hypothetical protein